MNKYKINLLFIILLIYTYCFLMILNADNSYYYSENTGWHNYNQINVSSTAITGWVWCENIGWIVLNPPHGGVIIDAQGNCSGYAYGENVGWINFGPILGGVRVGSSSGSLNGWAWGENIGWIRFDGNAIDFSDKNLRVLPNYIKSGDGQKAKIYLGGIDNPQSSYNVKIYTVGGRHLVKDFGAKTYTELNTGLEWNLKYDNGRDLKRGLYVIIVTGGGKEYKRDFYYFK